MPGAPQPGWSQGGWSQNRPMGSTQGVWSPPYSGPGQQPWAAHGGWIPPQQQGQYLYGAQGAFPPVGVTRQPQRSGLGTALGIILAVVAVVGVGVALLARGTADLADTRHTPTAPAPPPAATSARELPTPRPTESRSARPVPSTTSAESTSPVPKPDPRKSAQATVQEAPIYQLGWPELTDCAEPTYLETREDLEKVVERDLACVQRAWKPAFSQLGYPTKDIPHYFYEGVDVTSPCGKNQAPALYCSANGGSLYFGTELLRPGSWNPIWTKLMVFHEYGHHLQGQSGMFDAYRELSGGNEVVRRSEIQAECFATGMLRHDATFEASSENEELVRNTMTSFLDDGIHGSPESLLHWGMQGYNSSTLGEGCNTWVAGSEQVR